MTIYIVAFLVSLYFLAQSSSWLVRALIGISRLLRISEYTTAFILMSFTTSIPELFVGISSATSGAPELSFGNILGANLINILVILGLASLIAKRGLSVDSKISRQNFFLIFGLVFLPILLALDGVISKTDGLVLLLAFFAYIWRVAKEREHFRKIVNHREKVASPLKKTLKKNRTRIPYRVFKYSFLFLIGIAALLVSSGFIVWSAENLSSSLKIGFFSFGIIFVAIGTTLPELAFGLKALSLRHSAMVVGTVLGSIALNSSFVVGVTSIIHPISVRINTELLIVSLFLFLGFVLFNVFVYSKSVISRREGLLLLAVYAIFIIIKTLL